MGDKNNSDVEDNTLKARPISKGVFSQRICSEQNTREQGLGLTLPGDFRSWESPQTLPTLFIGHSEHVEQFRNLKFAVKRITNIQSTVLSSSEGTAAIHFAFK